MSAVKHAQPVSTGPYVSARELADRLGVSKDTIRRRTAQGIITAHRIRGGRALRYDLAEAIAQLDQPLPTAQALAIRRTSAPESW
jgi:excisionase family DNA binding protein